MLDKKHAHAFKVEATEGSPKNQGPIGEHVRTFEDEVNSLASKLALTAFQIEGVRQFFEQRLLPPTDRPSSTQETTPPPRSSNEEQPSTPQQRRMHM